MKICGDQSRNYPDRECHHDHATTNRSEAMPRKVSCLTVRGIAKDETNKFHAYGGVPYLR